MIRPKIDHSSPIVPYLRCSTEGAVAPVRGTDRVYSPGPMIKPKIDPSSQIVPYLLCSAEGAVAPVRGDGPRVLPWSNDKT
ncbi:unnamed protein product, partial [Iphiclides podalirius]